MTRRKRNARIQCLDPYAELCELIERWVVYDLKSVTGGLGYPRKSLDFTFIISPASSVDPTGYSVEDHKDIASAVMSLADTDGKLFAAIAMYYKPWTIRGYQDAGYPAAPHQTFYDRLVRAHTWIDREMFSTCPAYAKKFARDEHYG